MTKKHEHTEVRSRNEPFVQRTATRIWRETPSDKNPYIASEAACHGYDLHELMQKRSFIDVLYLLFRGELPTSAEAQLLEALMIGLINPGPRHPAVRAAMSVGVGKSRPEHILPIAAGVLGGDYLGGGEIESAIRFLRKNQKRDPHIVIHECVAEMKDMTSNNNLSAIHENSIPGFGQVNGGIDILCQKTAATITQLPGAGKALKWGTDLVNIAQEKGFAWLPTGLAAAVFADLGFQPRVGGSLFQLFSAPGALAHGLELANKPMTSMPFVKDEDYVIER